MINIIPISELVGGFATARVQIFLEQVIREFIFNFIYCPVPQIVDLFVVSSELPSMKILKAKDGCKLVLYFNVFYP